MTPTPRPWLKPAVDFIPLAVFLVFYWRTNLYWATASLMVTVIIGVIVFYAFERKFPIMPVVTAALVIVFGGLTLLLDDERFIKMKPTMVQGLFSLIMFGGLLLKKPVLKPLFSHAWRLQDEGWHKLTLRFGIFFLASAILNELVWRTQSTDFWVSFKVFGLISLTVIFIITQLPLIQRYQISDGAITKTPD